MAARPSYAGGTRCPLTGKKAYRAVGLGCRENSIEESIWLDRMVRPYRTPTRSLLRTHPETEERVERLLDLARQERRDASDDLDGLFACPGNLA